MPKHFIEDGKVVLIHSERFAEKVGDIDREYDNVVFAETPEKPEVDEDLDLLYGNGELYWQLKDK